jgi:hypothetical protein
MMAGNKILNPESIILKQSEGMWQKYVSLLVFKLAKEGVHITSQDIVDFGKQEKNTLLTHGHHDSIEFRLVTMAEAERLAGMEKEAPHGHA